MSSRTRLLLSFSLVAALAACSKSKPDTMATASPDGDRVPKPATSRGGEPVPGTATVTPIGPADGMPSIGAVYFDFDSTTLSPDARAALARLGAWLVEHPARIQIEGHADDRGTDEYNIALGQRRAQVIAEYLERLGVAPANLDTISYGEERPAVDGEDESAWAQNRRGEVHAR